MSAAGNRARAAEAGFTLIEALVTVAIAALVAGIGFPAVERQIGRVGFVTASNEAVLALRETRAVAMRGDRDSRLMLATDRRTLLRDGTSVYVPPADIALSLPPRGIVFHADGTASAGAVTLADRTRRRALAVDALTGAVSVTR